MVCIVIMQLSTGMTLAPTRHHEGGKKPPRSTLWYSLYATPQESMKITNLSLLNMWQIQNGIIYLLLWLHRPIFKQKFCKSKTNLQDSYHNKVIKYTSCHKCTFFKFYIIFCNDWKKHMKCFNQHNWFLKIADGDLKPMCYFTTD